MEEEWRAIAGFPFHEVSTHGRVRTWRGRRGAYRTDAPRIVVPSTAGKGYLKVILPNEDGSYTHLYLHSLVLDTFVGPRPSARHHARHFPVNDRRNCRLDNLRWGTPTENAADKAEHGTDPLGERNGASVLCDASVKLIRYLRTEHGASFRALAEWFGVSAMTAHRAWSGELWGHV